MKDSLLVRLHTQIAVFAALLVLCGPIEGKDVFRWADATGRIHYSDHAVQGAVRMDIDTAPVVHRVKLVFDGDTFLLDNGEKVRLLGINTPEVDSPKKMGEAGGEEAKQWLQSRLTGRMVRLEQDRELRDKYGRMLAHVFTENREHVNLTLVDAGLAFVDIHPPNLKFAEALTRAQNRAEQARRGIWGMPEYRAKSVGALIARPRLRGWQRLTGRPTGISSGRRYVRLKFSDRFEVRIAKKNLSLFPPLKTYLTQTVETRGWVSRRRGNYSIFVKHPSALVIRR
ncbi:Micrococcal nuclease-like nuclease [Methylocaldum marinum]|uniref:Micrococcal nuclease-like nuclease n=1 Tax=Methylocaldum marinum TaxID=1432792 RepID=A0A250KP45_9GAMM|nr:thermonuclease family protein [Methylocaldum marinum]BBA33445.1 Micrococcal nuclease-like nuclease [Methylocaldum marinum]